MDVKRCVQVGLSIC